MGFMSFVKRLFGNTSPPSTPVQGRDEAPPTMAVPVDSQYSHDCGQERDSAHCGSIAKDSSAQSDATPTGYGQPVHSQLDAYIVLDFETTGLSCVRDAIIEIGAVKFSGGIEIDLFTTYVNPLRPIPTEITRLTGISDEDVMGAPSILDAASALHKFIKGLPIVAHNASFDIGFLQEAYKAIGVDEEIVYIDTLQMARDAFPNAPNHKLSTLIAYLSIEGVQEHRSLSDVRYTNQIFLRCLPKVDICFSRKSCAPASFPPKTTATLTEEQRAIAEWAKSTLINAGRDVSLLAFGQTSKWFRISYFYTVLDIKLGGKLQYVLVESKYLHLFDQSRLSPCPASEGPSCDEFRSMRFHINKDSDLNELSPLLLAAFDSTYANYQSVKKWLKQRDLDAHFMRVVQI